VGGRRTITDLATCIALGNTNRVRTTPKAAVLTVQSYCGPLSLTNGAPSRSMRRTPPGDEALSTNEVPTVDPFAGVLMVTGAFCTTTERVTLSPHSSKEEHCSAANVIGPASP
jgi:hypothetical protein